MASPSLSVHDHHDHHDHDPPAPPSDTATTLAHTHSLLPSSPNAIAAAVTLATLLDSRPSTSYGQDHADVMDDDDDYSGGVSLVDMQQFMEESLPGMPTAQEEDPITALMTQQIAPWFHLTPLPAFPDTTLDMLDLIEPSIPYHVSNVHVPPHPPFISHLLSSESSLEPPPILHDYANCVHDKAAFLPITSFFHRVAPQRPTVPGLDLQELPTSITRHDLQGDSLDCQGIDWTVRNTTRSAMRAKRVEYETERLGSFERAIRRANPPPPNKDSFFQFRRNNLLHRPFVPHYQLRNIITSTSRNDIFYVVGKKVLRADADGAAPEVLTDLHKHIGPESLITTITAQDSTLITGAFDGEYSITPLSSAYDTAPTIGRTSHFTSAEKSRIVNHLHLFPSRFNSSPQAAFCSNNKRLQILDCTTNTFTHTFSYHESPNCAATSPDGRLRVIVGDFPEALITNAETGRSLEVLKQHHDAAFACAWADDGIHVATAAQDHKIIIWDARNWSSPVASMTSEVSIPRSLRFSPVGSGPRVLVCAEADDYVSVIDAVGWESKQSFDFFGPIGGVSFTPDGRSLFVANTERRFGGIVELERVGVGSAATRERNSNSRSGKCWQDDYEDHGGWGEMADWMGDAMLDDNQRVVEGWMGRQRRGVDFGGLVV
ncbi:hypothetical protein T440DRAFT_557110 [Plenodomus tracheiphilus IPT5]|uniref:Uncharacterized protein n=1 Tax=Plenodomus tracheiphilus IPT5 TaxID=1408161 RepID=A0A6A7AX96_9PLEO|nr:hypothetical protein T440DRAFT_557110 [Plenodomus tracheiphilus IPT5]